MGECVCVCVCVCVCRVLAFPSAQLVTMFVVRTLQPSWLNDVNGGGSCGARRYCHCKPCTRFRGVSPVHLLGVKPSEGQSPITVTKGEEYVKIVGDQKYGSMEHAFCTECGCALFQSPKGAGFRAVSTTACYLALRPD
jgi:hypothetical protein